MDTITEAFTQAGQDTYCGPYIVYVRLLNESLQLYGHCFATTGEESGNTFSCAESCPLADDGDQGQKLARLRTTCWNGLPRGNEYCATIPPTQLQNEFNP